MVAERTDEDMRILTGTRSRATFYVLIALAVSCGVIAPMSSAQDTVNGAWSEVAVAAARSQLVDQLASEDIARIDFRAPTFEEAMSLIETTASQILILTREDFATPGKAVEYVKTITTAFDDHKPRGLSTTFLDDISLPVSDSGSAQLLAEVLGNAAVIVRQHVGAGGSEADVARAAENLFQTPILDPEEGGYLTQYHDELQRIAQLPRADRIRFLER